ncbi:MAG TPA: SMC family ATPase, partial [Clostridiales bacterium]|nr:SMC family ATPase [Clostridiales bacterium]
MKPLMLKMSAFGPFADVVDVPFLSLDSQGLFLITGNTGAGKTTIFDAISFALYGNTSGITRTVDTVRSDFALPSNETFVYLEFLHKGKRYTVKRNPQYIRPKKSGVGTTPQVADAILTYPDGSVITGANNVTKSIEQLLCIDWKQFKQVVMIAQGEFLNLILADSNERGAILRKVFNTQIYADVQMKLKDMASTLKKECTESDNTIVQHLSDINCDENSDSFQLINEWKLSPSIHKAKDIFIALEKILTTSEEKIGITKEELVKIENEISKNAVEYEIAKLNNDKLTKLGNLNTEKSQMLDKADEISKKNEEYSFSQKAINIVKPFEEKFIREKNDRNEITVFIVDTNEKASELEGSIAELKAELEQSEQKLPMADEINLRVKKTESELDLYDSAFELSKSLEELKKKKESVFSLITNKDTEKGNLEKEQSKISSELKELDNVEEDFFLCDKKLSDVKQMSDKIEQMLDEYNKNLIDKKALEKSQEQFLELEKQYKLKNGECSNADSEFLQAQAGIMASGLQDNEKCPVCGSTSHPCKATLSETLITESELKQLKEETAELYKAVDKLSHECGTLKARYELNYEKLDSQVKTTFQIGTDLVDINAVLAEQSEKNLCERKTLELEYKKLQKDKEKKLESKEKLQKIIDEIIEIDGIINSKKTRLTEIDIEIGKVDERIKSINKQLSYRSKEEAIQKINDDKEKYNQIKSEFENANKNYNECNVEIESLKAVLLNNEQKLSELEKSHAKAEQKFIQKLNECGFENEETYHKYLISNDDLQLLIDEINEYKDRMMLINENITQLETETKDIEIVCLTDIISKKEALIEGKKLHDETIQKLSNNISNNNRIYLKVDKELKSLNDKRDKFMLVNELSKTANGDLVGKQKLAFEQYIQAFYFEKVIHEANKRL